ncbi:hypothetical protein [Hyphobacterium sp.]
MTVPIGSLSGLGDKHGGPDVCGYGARRCHVHRVLSKAYVC